MIKFPCLQSTANNEAEDSDAGQVLLCGNCGAKVAVPVPVRKALPVVPPVARIPAEPKVIERVIYVQQAPAPQKDKTSGCAWAVLIILISFIAMLYYAGGRGQPYNISSQGVRDYEVIALAQGMVEDKLRAPSTAKWVRKECWAKPIADGKWESGIVVDAQNGFGAMIRSRYVLELWPKVAGSNDWQGRIISGD